MLTGNRSQKPTPTTETITEGGGDTQSEQAQKNSSFFADIRLCDVYFRTLLATEVTGSR